jgi:hypothetical protein
MRKQQKETVDPSMTCFFEAVLSEEEKTNSNSKSVKEEERFKRNRIRRLTQRRN